MRAKPNIPNRYIFAGDIVLIPVSILGAFVLRFELGSLFFSYLPVAYTMIVASLVIKPLVYYLFGLYRRMWLYASVEELRLIVAAVTTASILVSLVMMFIFVRGWTMRTFVLCW